MEVLSGMVNLTSELNKNLAIICVRSDADEYMARLRKYGTHPLNLHALLLSII
jgi:hypothetical protein